MPRLSTISVLSTLATLTHCWRSSNVEHHYSTETLKHFEPVQAFTLVPLASSRSHANQPHFDRYMMKFEGLGHKFEVPLTVSRNHIEGAQSHDVDNRGELLRSSPLEVRTYRGETEDGIFALGMHDESVVSAHFHHQGRELTIDPHSVAQDQLAALSAHHRRRLSAHPHKMIIYAEEDKHGTHAATEAVRRTMGRVGGGASAGGEGASTGRGGGGASRRLKAYQTPEPVQKSSVQVEEWVEDCSPADTAPDNTMRIDFLAHNTVVQAWGAMAETQVQTIIEYTNQITLKQPHIQFQIGKISWATQELVYDAKEGLPPEAELVLWNLGNLQQCNKIDILGTPRLEESVAKFVNTKMDRKTREEVAIYQIIGDCYKGGGIVQEIGSACKGPAKSQSYASIRSGWRVVPHEIGHTLGAYHPFDNPFGIRGEEGTTGALMDYTKSGRYPIANPDTNPIQFRKETSQDFMCPYISTIFREHQAKTNADVPQCFFPKVGSAVTLPAGGVVIGVPTPAKSEETQFIKATQRTPCCSGLDFEDIRCGTKTASGIIDVDRAVCHAKTYRPPRQYKQCTGQSEVGCAKNSGSAAGQGYDACFTHRQTLLDPITKRPKNKPLLSVYCFDGPYYVRMEANSDKNLFKVVNANQIADGYPKLTGESFKLQGLFRSFSQRLDAAVRIDGDRDDVYFFSGDSMLKYTLDVGVHGTAPIKIGAFFSKGDPFLVGLVSGGIDAASVNANSVDKGSVLLFKNDVAVIANILTGTVSDAISVLDLTLGRFAAIDAIIYTPKYWHFFDSSGHVFPFRLSSSRMPADQVPFFYKKFDQARATQCAVENCQECEAGSTTQCAQCKPSFHSLQTWCHSDAIISHLDFNSADSQYWGIYADAANSRTSGEFVTAQLNNGLRFRRGDYVTMKKPTISPLGEFGFSLYFKASSLDQPHVLMQAQERCPSVGEQLDGRNLEDANTIELRVNKIGGVEFNFCGKVLFSEVLITTEKFHHLAVFTRGALSSIAVDGAKREITRSESPLNNFRPVFAKWELCPKGSSGCDGVLDQVEFRGSALLNTAGGFRDAVSAGSAACPAAAIVLAAVFALLL